MNERKALLDGMQPLEHSYAEDFWPQTWTHQMPRAVVVRLPTSRGKRVAAIRGGSKPVVAVIEAEEGKRAGSVRFLQLVIEDDDRTYWVETPLAGLDEKGAIDIALAPQVMMPPKQGDALSDLASPEMAIVTAGGAYVYDICMEAIVDLNGPAMPFRPITAAYNKDGTLAVGTQGGQIQLRRRRRVERSFHGPVVNRKGEAAEFVQPSCTIIDVHTIELGKRPVVSLGWVGSKKLYVSTLEAQYRIDVEPDSRALRTWRQSTNDVTDDDEEDNTSGSFGRITVNNLNLGLWSHAVATHPLYDWAAFCACTEKSGLVIASENSTNYVTTGFSHNRAEFMTTQCIAVFDNQTVRVYTTDGAKLRTEWTCSDGRIVAVRHYGRELFIFVEGQE